MIDRKEPIELPNPATANIMPDGGSQFIVRNTNTRYLAGKCPCGCPGSCTCGTACNRCNCDSVFDVYQDSNAKANAHGIRSYPSNDGIDWRVEQTPGANCTHDDNAWHFVEPRMILKDNCLSCQKWQTNANYNPPGGMLNSLAAQHDYDVETQNQVHGMVYDDFSIPKFEGQHTLSRPMNTGIVPVKCDCAAKLAASSGCGGTGCPN